MKKIPLTQGKFALVDDEDYARIAGYKWFAHRRSGNFYAARQASIGEKKQIMIHMHQEVLQLYDATRVCDHINGDGLDNRRCNLRVATKSENSRNRKKRRGCSSRFKGVFWRERNKKWEAQVGLTNGERKTCLFLGSFSSEEDAARVYDAYAREIYGKFARTNFAE